MGQKPMTNNQTTDIGSVLSQAREAKGMSIASAAMHTNLRKDIIEKLENNQFGDIGAPVFTRGYLNIYARFLDVDETLVARQFSAAAPVRHEQTLKINSANVESQSKPYKRSMARGWISLGLVLVVGGVLIAQLINDQSWLMQQIRGTFNQQVEVEESTVTPTEEPELQQAEEPGFTVEVAGDSAVNDIPSLTSIELEALPEDSNPEAGNSADINLSSLQSEDEATPTHEETEEPVVAGKATLVTNQENWIEVTDGNGKVIASKIFKAGDEIPLDAVGSPYRLNIGRPNAITLTVNGEVKNITDYRSKTQSRIFSLSVPNE